MLATGDNVVLCLTEEDVVSIVHTALGLPSHHEITYGFIRGSTDACLRVDAPARFWSKTGAGAVDRAEQRARIAMDGDA